MIHNKSTLSLNSQQNPQAQDKVAQLKTFFETGQHPPQPHSPQENKKTPKANQQETPAKPKVDSKEKDQNLRLKAKKERDKNRQAAFDWLLRTYPHCFSKENPKPLKLKIEKDIFAELPENLAFSRLHIREALGFYTRWSNYKEILAKSTHRYDLRGNAVEEVLADHKTHAQQQYKKRQKKFPDLKE
ncbi:MAG: ProQ/FinO family protein [Candidatus Paracaedibacteraceae bacterium]|nr:ProQ/FinO family protein [Candidatus Paracaedibacteraceae bacterium]